MLNKKQGLAISACAALLLIIAITLSVILFPAGLSSRPDVVFNTIDGRKIVSSQLQGKPLLVSFWATTCATCVQKTPALIALYEKMHPRGLEIIAVAMDYDPPNRILAYARDNNVPYPISLDLDGQIATAFDSVSVTPTTYLFDMHGKIVSSYTGDFEMAELEIQILKIVGTQSEPALPEAA